MTDHLEKCGEMSIEFLSTKREKIDTIPIAVAFIKRHANEREGIYLVLRNSCPNRPEDFDF